MEELLHELVGEVPEPLVLLEGRQVLVLGRNGGVRELGQLRVRVLPAGIHRQFHSDGLISSYDYEKSNIILNSL